MTALERYVRSVERLEQEARRGGMVRPANIQRLMNTIRAIQWDGGDERGEAQMLVYRLELLRQSVAAR